MLYSRSPATKEPLPLAHPTWPVRAQLSECWRSQRTSGNFENRMQAVYLYGMYTCIAYVINNCKHKYLIESVYMLWSYWKTIILLSYSKFCSHFTNCLSLSGQQQRIWDRLWKECVNEWMNSSQTFERPSPLLFGILAVKRHVMSVTLLCTPCCPLLFTSKIIL